MKKILPACLRGLIFFVALLCINSNVFASHIVGGDLNYQWVSGNTYKVSVTLYGNCGTTTGAFQTLAIATPQVCVYNGTALFATLALTLDATSPGNSPCGKEITPVCPADTALTKCTSTSFAIEGIKRYIYVATVTLSGPSHNWRFVYTSNNGSGVKPLGCGNPGSGSPSGAGRAASITNIVYSSNIQLIDTLDNFFPGIFSHNSSPILTVVPTPFFCLNNTNCYNPGALDPDGDSLRFQLVSPTNGSGGCGSVGGAVSYAAITAWPGQPIGPATPVQCTAASYLFDAATGQICFYPNVLQRSVVVYNIREYRNDTFVGTSQREMTFLVLTCTSSVPVSALAGTSGVIVDDTTHYHVCGNSGAFCMTYTATETDTTKNITFTITGLPAGMTYTVTANGTPHPIVTVCGNTTLLTPGLYTFFLRMQDNNCPITGLNTQAYSVNIYPVPTIRDSIAFPATCFRGAIVYFIPGGTGKPWTIDLYHGPLATDTFKTWVDSVMVVDTLAPTVGFADSVVIYTNVSHQCASWLPIVIDPPPAILPVYTFTNPTFCGAHDGTIVISNLAPGVTDTIRYNYNGVAVPYVLATISASGTVTINGLVAGDYTNFVVTYGFCHSDPYSTVSLVNPPFPIRTLSSINPTRCGYCDGAITVYGLNPNQLDTVTYVLNGTSTSISYYVGPDSTVLFTGLCDGSTYFDIYVHTAGVCATTHLPGVGMTGPALRDSFSWKVNYGCHGDTVIFTNDNYSDSDHILTYHWYFGDGYSDTAENPNHIYLNSQTDTAFIAKLYATNGQCVDSMSKPIKLLNYISASYTFTPTPYICQLTPVNFGNTSVSLSPPDSAATTYAWNFGNGTSTGVNPTNVYPTTGTYNVMLIETNFVPCSDTFTQTIVVDTISGIKMDVTDSVLCRGKNVTFTATYATQGSTGNIWSVTDGFTMIDVNPIIHAFDAPGQFTVSVKANYRACPETTASKLITVYAYPDVYLGPDTSICPGSTSIILSDDRNGTMPGTSWEWSTGETGSQIVVTKPGYYYANVSIHGCTTSDTIWVQKDCYMDIPNVFSPNGDGVNDYFYPRQLLTRGLTTFTMNIYNRWGQLVYQASSIDGRGWDGEFNGAPQPQGVYVYVMDATFKDGQIEHHQGNLTLLR